MMETGTLRENMRNAVTDNVFMPIETVISEIIEENSTIRTYTLSFTDRETAFSFLPGQFVMLSVPGHGEAPISISSSPTDTDEIQLSVRKAGRLTSALHSMKAGEYVAVRGPYGVPFPVDELKGRDLLFVAGGIGLAPLRSLINYCRAKNREYGKITLCYGSRSPSDIAFRNDLDAWKADGSVDVLLTVDVPEDGWQGRTGLVTTLLDDLTINNSNTSALLCGPPVMIDAVISKLKESGMDTEKIITTLERNMKCGVGLCGHCHMEGVLICKDGPVFNVKALENIMGATG